jgi:hypothetical protein
MSLPTYLQEDADGRLATIGDVGGGPKESPALAALHAHLLWLRHELKSWEATVQLSF